MHYRTKQEIQGWADLSMSPAVFLDKDDNDKSAIIHSSSQVRMRSVVLVIVALTFTCVQCKLPEEDDIDTIKNETLKEIRRNELKKTDWSQSKEGVEARESSADDDDSFSDPEDIESNAEEVAEVPKKAPWGRRFFRRVRVRVRLRKAARAVVACYKIGLCG